VVLVHAKLTSIVGKKTSGSQWVPSTVWLPTLFKISYSYKFGTTKVSRFFSPATLFSKRIYIYYY